MSTALVPIKQLSAGKSRLLPDLRRSDLERLSIAMLGDLIDALRTAKQVERVAVVTPDEAVAKTAEAVGAEALLLHDEGLVPSLVAATEKLQLAAGDPLLVVLGDVPGALPADIDAIHEAIDDLGGTGVVIAASRDHGTSALLRSPHDIIGLRFGPNSAALHESAAREAGAPFLRLDDTSLAIDLDCAEDVETFLSSPGGGKRTRALLAELGWPATAENPSP